MDVDVKTKPSTVLHFGLCGWFCVLVLRFGFAFCALVLRFAFWFFGFWSAFLVLVLEK